MWDEGWVCIGPDGEPLFDERYERIIRQEYDGRQDGERAELFFARMGGKWGCIHADGSIVIPFRFWSVTPFSQGRAFVMNEPTSKYDMIDKSGNVIAGGIDLAMRHYDGYAPVRIGTEWTFIDSHGRIPFTERWSSTSTFSESLAAVEPGNPSLLYGYIDTSGNMVITPRYREAGHFRSGWAIVQDSETDLYGVIDRNGRWLAKPIYDSAERPMLSDDVAVVRKGDVQGVIDRDGIWIWKSDIAACGKNPKIR